MSKSLFFYRLPGEEKIFFGSSSKPYLGFPSGAGYLIAPFDVARHPVVHIPANPAVCHPEELALLDSAQEAESSIPMLTASTGKEQYLSTISNLITSLSRHPDNSKVVVSKVICVSLKQKVSEIFVSLCKAYPEAYVFAFHTPLTGLWIGASPELLVKSDGKRVTTMSLAGTRQKGTVEPWSEKNLREQKIVTDYIHDVMSHQGLNPDVSTLNVKVAGPVEHLCQEIRGNAPVPEKLYDFCLALSPTPALCGYPKQAALSWIGRHEPDRGYYGGYCGYVDGDKVEFNVTIRCMHILGKMANIHVGGGITAGSKAEEEWEETEIKARTLLALIS